MENQGKLKKRKNHGKMKIEAGRDRARQGETRARQGRDRARQGETRARHENGTKSAKKIGKIREKTAKIKKNLENQVKTSKIKIKEKTRKNHGKMQILAMHQSTVQEEAFKSRALGSNIRIRTNARSELLNPMRASCWISAQH